MKRQPLTDGTGRWFDIESARRFSEAQDETGTRRNHEALYLTRTGRWILHRYSQWEGVRDRWEEIPESDATAWLIKNRHNPVNVGLGEVAQTLEV